MRDSAKRWTNRVLHHFRKLDQKTSVEGRLRPTPDEVTTLEYALLRCSPLYYVFFCAANAHTIALVDQHWVNVMLKRNLQTVTSLAAGGPFSEGQLRWWIFTSATNGLAAANAVVMVGRRVYIDLDRFEDWIEQQNRRSAS